MQALTQLRLTRLNRRLHQLWLPETELVLDPATALGEFRKWLEDEYWWRAGRAAGWRGMFEDLIDSFDAAGNELGDALSSAWRAASPQLDAFLVRLHAEPKKRPFSTRTPVAREALYQVEEDLRGALGRPDVLRAAWTGLVGAVCADAPDVDLDRRQVEMINVGELVGHPWDRLLRMLGGLLADVDRNVDEARRDIAAGAARLQAGRPAAGHAGLSVEERLALIDDYLALPVAEVASEVWVGVEDAFFRAPISVGPVTFYPGLQLQRDVAAGSETLPARVQAETALFEWLWEDREERAEFALAEVKLPPGSPAGARHDARATVGALCRIAEFDEGYSAWRLSEQGLLQFVGSEWVWREKLERGREPRRLTSARIARDATPYALEQRAQELAPALPLSTASREVRHLTELIGWLSEGRKTSGAAQTVLTRRVVERVAGWCGFAPEKFADQHLRLAWARHQAISRIGDATRDAISLLARTPGESATKALLEAASSQRHIIDDDFLSRQVVFVAQAVTNFDWLLRQLPELSDERREMRQVSRYLSDGPTCAAWIRALARDFAALQRRYTRQRNAIVHGGPIDDAAVATLIRFADALAVDVIDEAFHAVLAGDAFAAHFARRTTRHRDWLDALDTPDGGPIPITL